MNEQPESQRGICSILLAALALFTSAASPISAICLPIDDDRVEDQILVELEPGVSIDTIAARYAITPLDSILEWNLWKVATLSGADVDAIVDTMNGDQEIVEAEPHRHFETPEGVQRTIADLDFTATSDTFLNQPAATTIKAAAAHQKYTGDGVIVAVLDTAQALSHPDTVGNMYGPGIDIVDGNATADVPANGIDDDNDGLIDESDQHGTYVTGLVRLAAPGARILAIRVLEEDGKGDAFSIAKGIVAAIAAGAKVINLSFGITHDPKPIERALEDAEDAGIVIVAAAGNRNTPCVDFPAYRKETLAVAAVDNNLVKTEFSSYGPEIDLSAPGLDMLSTYESDLYADWDGTSFAAPLVSGGAALLFEKYPGLRGQTVKNLIKGNTQPDANPPELAGLMGSGVLDLDAITNILTTDRTSLKIRKDAGGSVVRWSPVLGAGNYDVARGNIANLRRAGDRIDLGPLVCIANNTTVTDTATAPDATVPGPGQAFFYVFRDDAPDALGGSYGMSSSGLSRIPGPSDCPIPG